MKLRIIFTSLLLLLLLPLSAQGFKVILKVTAVTGENLADTPVKLEHLDYGIIYPTTFLSDKGECTFVNVLEGKNQLTITKEGLAKYIDDNLVITQDTTLNIVLQEPVRKPYALKTENIHNVYTGQTDVLLNWNKETDYFFDDFESYDAFSIDFAPWTGIDGDKAPAARLSGSYPNSELPQYATIFNPLTISPPLWYEYPVLRPFSGKQYVAFIRTADGTANNDWLISPRIDVGVNNTVSFKAKAGDVYKEQFKVLVSTSGTEMKDFTALTPGNYELVGYEQWKTVQYDLSAYEGKEVYIAIQYLSKAYFMLMVDDFYLGPKGIEPSKSIRKTRAQEIAREKFVVYCDNDSIDTVTEPSYLFKDLKAGTHKLGVKAKYQVSQSETSFIDATVAGASNYASVKISVTSNNELSMDDTPVNYVNRSTGEQTNDQVKNGISELKSLSKGDYLINISREGYETYNQSITIDKNTNLDVQLKELIIAPYNITADTTVLNGKTDALIKWNQDLGFSDGFESYPDFSQTFGDWTTVDVDKMAPYGINLDGQNITFPGANEPSPGMVFNNKTTTPSMEADGAIAAPEGDKCYVFFSVQSGQSNDWLISPVQTIRDNYVVRFLAKSYSGMYNETVEIGISDKKEIASFTPLDEITTTDTWTRYEIDLSAYAGQDMYIAIHYKSLDKFLMLFDSFYVGPGKESSSVVSGNATYEIWLNGDQKASVKENSYQFRGLADGTYTVGIKAIYKSGSSGMTEYTFTCNTTSITGTGMDGIRVYGEDGNIRIEAQEANAGIRICNTAGQPIYEAFLKEGTTIIPANPGIYILKIVAGDKETVRKVVVN